ncbi:NmrA family protein [Trametes elegans]|nr:NmrA family protein [Trametes elegans]
MSKLIAVTGATGQYGSSVVDFPLKEPDTFSIRAITRDPTSEAAQAVARRGVEVVQANLSNLDETAAAFAGAWGVFGLTQFYVHGFEAEQLHGRNIVDEAVRAGVKFLVWSTALIEERVMASGIPYTFIHIPMYYENFFTNFFQPNYDQEKGFSWNVGSLPDSPIFAFSVADVGGLVVEPEKIKTVVEYLTSRDIATQFAEDTGEKAGLGRELTREQLEASRYADHPAAEYMYFSWEYILRAGPEIGVRDRAQTLSIYPHCKTYREWLKDSQLFKDFVQKMKEGKRSARTRCNLHACGADRRLNIL